MYSGRRRALDHRPSLKLPPEDLRPISADLFAFGLATLVQFIGFPGVGIRLPS